MLVMYEEKTQAFQSSFVFFLLNTDLTVVAVHAIFILIALCPLQRALCSDNHVCRMHSFLSVVSLLSLYQAVQVAQVQLTFDTGMHRQLTFSVVQNGVGIWGPQPETVRDYTIEGSVGGRWTVLCNVTGNFQACPHHHRHVWKL